MLKIKQIFNKKSNKKMSIFMGKKVRKYWELEDYGKQGCYLTDRTETLERVKILEKEMDFGFEDKQEIFLEELGKYATIEKKTKDTNGNTIYNVTYVIETVKDYDKSLKEKYDTLKAIQKESYSKQKIETEKLEEDNKLKKQEEKIEYDKYCEDKKLTVKKGVLIQRLPISEGKPIVDMKTAQIFHNNINKLFPDYDIVTTLMDVEIFNYDNKGKIVGIKDGKDSKILLKN